MEELSGWFAGRIPAEWFQGAPTVTADREEIYVVGMLSEPELPADAGPRPAKPRWRRGSPASARTRAASGCASPTRPSDGSAAR